MPLSKRSAAGSTASPSRRASETRNPRCVGSPAVWRAVARSRSRRQPERPRTKAEPERGRSRNRRFARSIDSGATSDLAQIASHGPTSRPQSRSADPIPCLSSARARPWRPERHAAPTHARTGRRLGKRCSSCHCRRSARPASQGHEGWVCLSQGYNDGGFSGATTDRPALQRLLADITAGHASAIRSAASSPTSSPAVRYWNRARQRYHRLSARYSRARVSLPTPAARPGPDNRGKPRLLSSGSDGTIRRATPGSPTAPMRYSPTCGFSVVVLSTRLGGRVCRPFT